MATLYNQNGTNAADILDFTVDGTYHAKGGNDTINIKGGSVIVYTDSGNNTINVTGGRGHTIKVAADDKESDKGYGVEKLTIDGADAVEAYLGAGNDEIVLVNTNGKKTSGASSAIHGGAWSDTFTVKAGARNYQLYGDAGNDTFNISGGSNMNFWGGAANDTFNVTGGTNNKLYGGDSADTFNISAGSQNLILGYGKDVVNITSGDKQQIKANLGINTINLKAGSGHVITADIDRAASKKKGYTDEQINAGQGIGYGQDKVYISGTASGVTAHLGDGRDYVSVSSGSGHEIYTEGWNDTIDISGTTNDSLFDAGAGNDIINIKGGNNNTVIGGTGSDTYNVTWINGHLLTIDNSSTKSGEIEKINFTNAKSSDFTYVYDDRQSKLIMKDTHGGSITLVVSDYLAKTAHAGILNFTDKNTSIQKILSDINKGDSVIIPSDKTEIIIKSSDVKNRELSVANTSGELEKFTFDFSDKNLRISDEDTKGTVVIDSSAVSKIDTINLNKNAYKVVYAEKVSADYNYTSSNNGILLIDNSTNDIDVSGSNYNDYIQCSTTGSTVFGNAGNDVLKIVAKNDGKSVNNIVLNGGDGNDYIASMSGTGHTLIGGNGNDTLIVRNQAGGGVDISGGAGNDKYIIGMGFNQNTSNNSGIVTIDQSDAAAGDSDVLILEKASRNSITFSLTSGILSITSSNGSKDSVYVLAWDEHALSKIYLGNEASKVYVTGESLNNAFKQTSKAILSFGDGSSATYNVSYDSTSLTKTLVFAGNK